ncbi:MAG: DUF4097 family beta strand repeat-containing protein [Clostridiales bacterium]
MKKRRVGTISMGIMLTAFGVIILMAQLTDISILKYIKMFWPIIFIILGVEILIYNYKLKKDEDTIKYDIASIVLIFIILFGGVIIYLTTQVFSEIGFGNILTKMNINKYETTYDYNKTVSSDKNDKILFKNKFGDVNLEKSNNNNVEVEANIKIKNNDEKYVKSIIKSIVKVEKEKNIIKINSEIDKVLNSVKYNYNLDIFGMDFNNGSVMIDYTIKVPSNIEIEGENAFGNVDIKGLESNVIFKSQNGDVLIDKNKGNVDLENSFGYTNLTDIIGKIDLNSNNGDLDIDNVTKDVKAEAQFSNINIKNVLESLKVTNENGNTNIENVGKNLDVSSEFGNIDIHNAKKAMTIELENGNITIDNKDITKDNVKIKNEFGNIEYKMNKEQKGHFIIDNKFGNIESPFDEHMKDEPNSSLDKIVGNDDIKIEITNSNANIILKR